jgi:hypothetical protein
VRRKALLLTALLTAAGGLAACGQGAGADKASTPTPAGPHIDLAVDAPKTTHYEMLCDVRTYQATPGQYVNRYGVDKTGPFSDAIPSPSAHCTAKIDSGPGPVKVTLSKAGATQTMTIDTVGDDGKQTLHVW